MRLTEINFRDPFILPFEGMYYLYGTKERQAGRPCLMAYRSHDLINWEGPFIVFKPDENFWSSRDFWAPEVHQYRGKFYMFCTFKSDTQCRGTQILQADIPLGPYQPLTDGPVTPREWECLDGTLYVENGRPWIVFCHEWQQCADGEMYAMSLTEDLKSPAGEPIFLFKASEASWCVPVREREFSGKVLPCYVTDGPFLWKGSDDRLRMIWSSFSKEGYAIALAVSKNGVAGPWIQQEDLIFRTDGGHGMLFDTFDGKTCLVLHQPNQRPLEHPVIYSIEDFQLAKLK